MKKNVFKLLLSFIFIIAVCGGIFSIKFNNANNNVKAEEALKYVALGDSIADGTMLAGYQKYTFVEGAYTTLYKTVLEQMSTVEAVTYAKASSNTADLLSLLNGTPNARYSDLDASKVLQDISSADVITVCIGANDILLPAIDNIFDFITNKKTVADMEQILGNGIVEFYNNFPQVVSKLTELNPNATIIFNDVYNPYRNFELPSELAQVATLAGINVDNVNAIEEITELYLMGGVSSTGETNGGLNPFMKSYIEICGNENVKLAQVKDWFEKFLEGEGENGEPVEYSMIVNADPKKITLQNFMDFDSYADPHPTLAGHQLIASAVFYLNFELPDNPDDPVNPPVDPENPTNPSDPVDPSEPEEPVVEYINVIYNSYGGNLIDEMGNVFNVKTVVKGSKIINYVPTKEGFPFGGWYTDSKFTTKWNFNDEVTTNVALYAKWINLTCEDTDKKQQDITNVKEIPFSLDIDDETGFDISWYVESEGTETLIEGENGKTLRYLPTKSGKFEIKALVNGVMTDAFVVTITRSKMFEVTIALRERDVNNNFILEILNNTYSNSELKWYKSVGNDGRESKLICTGESILEHHFTENCTIWIQHAETDEIISNQFEIKVEKAVRTDIILGVFAGIVVVAIFITAVVITKRKYSDF